MTSPLDWSGGPFLLLYLGVAGAAMLVTWWLRFWIGPRGRASPPLEAVEVAYLAAGPQRAADTLLVDRLARGAMWFDKGTKAFMTDPAGGTRISRKWFAVDMGPRMDAVVHRLQQLGLLASPRQVSGYRIRAAIVVGVPVLLGLVKVFVGLDRGRPVDFLLVLLLATAAAACWIATRRPLRTRAGARALHDIRLANARAARAPVAAEMALGFALAGAAVLDSDMAHAFGPNRSDGSSGSGCSGGGDGGGGGGGGCGGCSG